MKISRDTTLYALINFLIDNIDKGNCLLCVGYPYNYSENNITMTECRVYNDTVLNTIVKLYDEHSENIKIKIDMLVINDEDVMLISRGKKILYNLCEIM